MSFKELYRRYRQWEINPFTYPASDGESHTCANCGQAFSGNFCPNCGQNAKVGPVTWRSVMETLRELLKVKDPGGLIPYFMQIFGRTGYFINDYISGRRMVCSSPVLYLGIMAGCAALVQSSTNQESHYELMLPGTSLPFLGAVLDWLSNNLAWALLLQTALLIIPTWLLFRNSPKHPRHNIPEGIYIQIFMCSLVLIVNMVRCVTTDWALCLMPLFYFIAYRQIFGYGVWGTTWRVLMCLGTVVIFFGVVMMSIRYIAANGTSANYSVWLSLGTTIALSAVLGALVLLGAWIDKKSAQRRAEISNSVAATSD